MELKSKLIHAHQGETNGRIWQIPVVGFIDLKAFVKSCFFIHKSCFVFELGLIAACRLGYLQEDWAFLAEHEVHDGELVGLLVWSSEHELSINMNKWFEYIP